MSRTLERHRRLFPDDVRSDAQVIFEIGSSNVGEVKRRRDPEFDEEYQKIRDANRPGVFESLGKGIARGVDTTQALGYGVVGLAGDAIGIDPIRDFGIEGYQENIAEAQKNKAFTHFKDIEGTADFFDWAVGGLGELAPTVLTTIAGAVGGAGVGGIAAAGGKKAVQRIVGDRLLKKFGKEKLNKMTRKELVDASESIIAKDIARKQIKRKGTKPLKLGEITKQTLVGEAIAKRKVGRELAKDAVKKKALGGQIGAVGSSMALNMGEVYGQFADNIDNPAVTRAERVFATLGFGGLAGLLDSALPLVAVNKFLPKESKDGMIKAISENFSGFMKAKPKSAAALTVGAATTSEGVTEATQELLSYMAGVVTDEGKSFSWDEISPQLVEAGALGALGGGVFGGVAAGAGLLNNQGDNKRVRDEPIDNAVAVVDQKRVARGEPARADVPVRNADDAVDEALGNSAFNWAVRAKESGRVSQKHQDAIDKELAQIKNPEVRQRYQEDVNDLLEEIHLERIEELIQLKKDGKLKLGNRRASGKATKGEVATAMEIQDLISKYPEQAKELQGTSVENKLASDEKKKAVDEIIELQEAGDTILTPGKDPKKDLSKQRGRLTRLKKLHPEVDAEIQMLEELVRRIVRGEPLTAQNQITFDRISAVFPQHTQRFAEQLEAKKQEGVQAKKRNYSKATRPQLMEWALFTDDDFADGVFIDDFGNEITKKVKPPTVADLKAHLKGEKEIDVRSVDIKYEGFSNRQIMTALKNMEKGVSTATDEATLKALKEEKVKLQREAKARNLFKIEGDVDQVVSTQDGIDMKGETDLPLITGMPFDFEGEPLEESEIDTFFSTEGTSGGILVKDKGGKDIGSGGATRGIAVRLPSGRVVVRGIVFTGKGKNKKWRVTGSKMTQEDAIGKVLKEHGGLTFVNDAKIGKGKGRKRVELTTVEDIKNALRSKSTENAPFIDQTKQLMRNVGYDEEAKQNNDLIHFAKQGEPLNIVTFNPRVSSDFVWRGSEEDFKQGIKKAGELERKAAQSIYNNEFLVPVLERLIKFEEGGDTLIDEEQRQLLLADGVKPREALLASISDASKYKRFFESIQDFAVKYTANPEAFVIGLLSTSRDKKRMAKNLDVDKPVEIFNGKVGTGLGEVVLSEEQLEMLFEIEDRAEFIATAEEFIKDNVKLSYHPHELKIVEEEEFQAGIARKVRKMTERGKGMTETVTESLNRKTNSDTELGELVGEDDEAQGEGDEETTPPGEIYLDSADAAMIEEIITEDRTLTEDALADIEDSITLHGNRDAGIKAWVIQNEEVPSVKALANASIQLEFMKNAEEMQEKEDISAEQIEENLLKLGKKFISDRRESLITIIDNAYGKTKQEEQGDGQEVGQDVVSGGTTGVVDGSTPDVSPIPETGIPQEPTGTVEETGDVESGAVESTDADTLTPELQGAVDRRNLDLKDGELFLPNGQPATPENAASLITKAEARVSENEDRVARLEALPDNATIKQIREAEGGRDSRASDKKATIRTWKNVISDSEQYIADLRLLGEPTPARDPLGQLQEYHLNLSEADFALWKKHREEYLKGEEEVPPRVIEIAIYLEKLHKQYDAQWKQIVEEIEDIGEDAFSLHSSASDNGADTVRENGLDLDSREGQIFELSIAIGSLASVEYEGVASQLEQDVDTLRENVEQIVANAEGEHPLPTIDKDTEVTEEVVEEEQQVEEIIDNEPKEDTPTEPAGTPRKDLTDIINDLLVAIKKSLTDNQVAEIVSDLLTTFKDASVKEMLSDTAGILTAIGKHIKLSTEESLTISDKLKSILGDGKEIKEEDAKPRTPVDREILELSGRPLSEVLKYLQGKARGQVSGTLMKMLDQLVVQNQDTPHVPVFFATSEEMLALRDQGSRGFYNPHRNDEGGEIYIDIELGLDFETIIHEALHAYTYNFLWEYAPNVDNITHDEYQALLEELKETAPKAVKDLVEAFEFARAFLTHEGANVPPLGEASGNQLYGLSNLDEFISEIFSNPEFMDILTAIPDTISKGESLVARIVRAINDILGSNINDTLFKRALTDATRVVALAEEHVATPDNAVFLDVEAAASPGGIVEGIEENLNMGTHTEPVEVVPDTVENADIAYEMNREEEVPASLGQVQEIMEQIKELQAKEPTQAIDNTIVSLIKEIERLSAPKPTKQRARRRDFTEEGRPDLNPAQAQDVQANAFNQELVTLLENIRDKGLKFLSVDSIAQKIGGLKPFEVMKKVNDRTKASIGANLDNMHVRLRNLTASKLMSKYSRMMVKIMSSVESLDKKILNNDKEWEEATKGRKEILSDPEVLAQYRFSSKAFINKIISSIAFEKDLNNSSNEVINIIRELEKQKGNDLVLAPQVYIDAFNKLKSPELVLQAIASMNIDWNTMTLKKALLAIQNIKGDANYQALQKKGGQNAVDAKAGADLLAKNPELLAFAVSYAKAYHVEIQHLEVRMSDAQGRFVELKKRQDELVGLSDEQLEKLEKKLLEELVDKSLIQARIQKKLVEAEARLRRSNKKKKELAQEREDLITALEEVKKQNNTYRGILGVVGSFLGKPGEDFHNMKPEVGAEFTIETFGYSGNNSKAYEAAFSNNAEWLRLNEGNKDIDPTLYATVERTNMILRYSIFKEEAQGIRMSWFTHLISSAQKIFNALGYNEGKRISQLMLNFQRTMNVWNNQFRPLAQRWEANETALRKASGYKSTKDFKEKILDGVYAGLEAEVGLFSDQSGLEKGWQIFKERLEMAGTEGVVDEESLRPAFNKFILSTKNLSEMMNLVREESGVTVEDPRTTIDILEDMNATSVEAKEALGAQRIKDHRKNVERLVGLEMGWMTVPRIVKTAELNYVLKKMFASGWGSRSTVEGVPSKFWWIGKDKEGNFVNTINELFNNPPVDPNTDKPIDLHEITTRVRAMFNEKLNVEGLDIVTQFLQPIIDHEISLFEGATPIEVRQAWDQSRGDIVNFATILAKNATSPDAVGAEQINRYINVFLNQFVSYDNLTQHEELQRSSIDGRIGNNFMANARTTRNIPKEFVTYASFDKGSNARQVMKLASQKYFGKEFEIFDAVFHKLQTNMNEDILEAKSKGDTAKQEELETLLRKAEHERRKYIQWYTKSEASPNNETRLISEILRTITIGMLSQPKSALNNLVSTVGDFFVVFRGVNGFSLASVKTSLQTLFSSPWWAMLETFGKQRHIPENEQWILEVSADINRQDLSFTENMAELGFGSQAVGSGSAQASIIRGLRRGQRALSQPFGKFGEGTRQEIAPSANVFDWVSRVSNHAISMGMLRAYTKLVEQLQTSGADPQKGFKNLDFKALGINKDAYDWMANRWFDMTGKTIEQLVIDTKGREGEGITFAKEEVYSIAQIAMNEVALESDVNTRPIGFMTGMMPTATLLLGWPVTKMAQINSSAVTEQGDIQWRLTSKFIANMAMVGGIGIAFTLLTDIYDEIFRGRAPNLRKLSNDQTPEQNFLAAIERMARIGTYGLGGDVVNSILNHIDTGAGQKGISIDDRVVAMSVVQNLMDAMSNSWQQRGVSWATVGRPLMSALGGNGVMQYSEILNNYLSESGDIPIAGDWLDTQRALTRKVNVSNIFRAVGRENRVELKKVGFGSPTPLGKEIRDMQVHAYNNDRESFLKSYQNAIQAAMDDGSEDPAKRVLASWRGRDPYFVFKSPSEAKDMEAQLLASMTPRNRADVKQTLELYRFYTRLITPAKSRGKTFASSSATARRKSALSSFSSFDDGFSSFKTF